MSEDLFRERFGDDHNDPRYSRQQPYFHHGRPITEVRAKVYEDPRQNLSLNQIVKLQEQQHQSHSSAAPQSSRQDLFFLDTTGAASTPEVNRFPKYSTNGSEELEDGEIIEYETGFATGTMPLKTSTHARESGNGNKSVYDYLSMGLDEVCRKRNIYPPPRYGRHQPYVYSARPLSGARAKVDNVDPYQNLSLDQIIKMKRRQHRRARRRHQFREARKMQQRKQDEQVKKGVATRFENPEIKNVANIAKWTPDAWQYLEILQNQGFNINWALKKRRNLVEGEESRNFRCIVGYNKVRGICEASLEVQAKHGAAVNFLQNFQRAFPLLSMEKFPDKVGDAILLEPELLTKLRKSMEQKYGKDYKLQFELKEEKVEEHILYICTVLLGSSKFDGVSWLGSIAAKRLAARSVLENFLGQTCSMMEIHMGAEQCTADESLYEGVRSKVMFYYDISKSAVVDEDDVRALSIKAAHKKLGSNHTHSQSPYKFVRVRLVDPRNQSANYITLHYYNQ